MRNRARSRRNRILTVAVACALALPAFGAELEEVTVTARKREENTQNVSTSIRAFSGEDVVALGISRPADLAMLTPGLNAKYSVGFESPIFTMRGVGLNDYSSINNPSVGVYFDDVFVPFIPMMGGQLYDVERIEVLKGPQGSLYGRNTTGGAIKFISRKPTAKTDMDLRAEYSSWNTFELEAAAGGALTDTLNGRAAVFTRQRGSGYQTNRFTGQRNGEQDRLGGRVLLDWVPSENFNALLNVHYGRDSSDAALREHIGFKDPVTGVITCPAVRAGNRGGCTDLQGYADTDNDPYTSDQDNLFGNKVTSTTYGTNLTMNWTVPRATLTSVSGFDRYRRHLVDDTDASPLVQFETIVAEHIKVFSQELRLVSDDSWRSKWVAGLFYSSDNVEASNTQAVDLLYKTRVRVLNDQTTRSVAAFGNMEYPLADKWAVTAGIRGTHEEKQRWTQSEDLATLGNISVLNPTHGPFVFVTNDATIKHDDVSGNLGLTFKPTDHVMTYANAARGFKSGGFKGNISFNPLQVGPYDPETLYAYELGLKSTLFDGSVRFNAAAFYYDWRDFQAYSLVQLAIPVVVLTNAGDAEVKGFETELSWRPTETLELGTATNLMEAKIVSFNVLPGGQDNNGKRLPNSPKFTVAAFGKYQFPRIAEHWVPYLQATVSYQSKVFYEIQNNPINSQDGYAITNLRAGLASGDSWDLALWVRNLGDKAYVSESKFVDLRTFPSANNYGEPRSYGASVNYRF
ncbi:MAG: TonB-dependent receptor [Gammaproteobacteria bacterium]